MCRWTTANSKCPANKRNRRQAASKDWSLLMRETTRTVNINATRRFETLIAFLLFALAACAQTPSEKPVKYDAGTISGLTARNIGSAVMSGRIAAVDAVDENGKITVFVGSASGGVWKSINAGISFKPIFDKQNVQSINTVTIDPSNHRIV